MIRIKEDRRRRRAAARLYVGAQQFDIGASVTGVGSREALARLTHARPQTTLLRRCSRIDAATALYHLGGDFTHTR
ncbi:MAG: hypothetical protein ACM3PD_00270 [Chloroflexota bacterium]